LLPEFREDYLSDILTGHGKYYYTCNLRFITSKYKFNYYKYLKFEGISICIDFSAAVQINLLAF